MDVEEPSGGLPLYDGFDSLGIRAEKSQYDLTTSVGCGSLLLGTLSTAGSRHSLPLIFLTRLRPREFADVDIRKAGFTGMVWECLFFGAEAII